MEIYTWHDETNEIVRSNWGFDTPERIAHAVNDWLKDFYTNQGSKGYPISSALSVKVQAIRLGIVKQPDFKSLVNAAKQENLQKEASRLETSRHSRSLKSRPEDHYWEFSTNKSWVYFVYDPKQDLIKIGVSAKLQQRFYQLVGGCVSLEFYGAVEGTREDEQEYHRMFGQFRIKREWFLPSPPVLFFIKYFSFSPVMFSALPNKGYRYKGRQPVGNIMSGSYK